MKIKIAYCFNGETHTEIFNTEEELMEWLDDNEIYQYEKTYIAYED